MATPITEFERGWVLSWLARAGVPVKAPPRLTAELRAALGSAGTGGGEGLPPDADTTSGVLYALSLLGSPCAPDLLSQYEMDTHFCTWQGENGRSVTTNAHVLEAFGHFLETTGGGTAAHRYSAPMFKITSWLCERQEADGSWRDRWHASPITPRAAPRWPLSGTAPGPGARVPWTARSAGCSAPSGRTGVGALGRHHRGDGVRRAHPPARRIGPGAAPG